MDCFGGKKSKNEMNNAVSGTEAIRTWDEHRIGTAQLCMKYGTNIQSGLTSEQATEFHKQYGDNALTKREGTPWYCLFLKELTGWFALLLWAGGILNIVGYYLSLSSSPDPSDLYLGIVLFLIVIGTAIFSYAQTSKSAEIMAQFENFIPPTAFVKRDGRDQKIDAKLIVPGDIIIISTGENIPCDIVIFQSNEMKVNNASLTGESEDIHVDPDLPPNDNILETKNAGFFGTSCTAGSGKGICIRTGDATVIGQIANLASSAETNETPIQREIEHFIKLISIIAIIFGIIFFIFGLVYGYDYITDMTFAIGIIVANVPEGLIATVTIIMALAAERMAKKMVLVKNLQSVETLGSTSCICSDKTGTLTQNRMTVSHMYYNRSVYNCQLNLQQHEKNQAKERPDEKLILGYDPKDPGFLQLVQAMILGTYTVFHFDPTEEQAKQLYARMRKVPVSSLEGVEIPAAEMAELNARLRGAEKKLLNIQRPCKGDASETGLVQFVQSVMDITETRDTYPVHIYKDNNKETLCQIPFSSDIKFNLFIRDMKNNADRENQNLCVFIKGAPERILNRCSKILVNGREEPFDQNKRNEVNQANSDFGRQGERVLAFAIQKLDAQKYRKEDYKFDVKNWKQWGLDPNQSANNYANVQGSFPMHDLTLVGIVSLNDPPRQKVDLSVQKCRDAGIKVIMVTGDQPPTAAAIANKVNILKNPEKEYNYMVDQLKMDKEKAWEQCTGIVIHGDLLAQKHLAEEHLLEDDPNKGQFLQQWISKSEVVFARTTPSQKLLIVDACQKAGHIVAVTGDGVNDSPAIKKADIGIAMGSGSDVAKNSADMLLLDDNFCSIVNGVEEGRLIFDNLKKSIIYTLTHNIAEVFPFIFFIIFQVPLPLSSILCIFIDLGTDMAPAISFAYENPELDIMERQPRNAKRDNLTNKKLFALSYTQIGVLEAAGGLFTYLLIMNDYGIRPTQIWYLALIEAPMVNSWDVYNQTQTTVYDYGNGTKSLFGNTNYGIDINDPNNVQLQWGKVDDGMIDIRLFYAYKCEGETSCRGADAWTTCRFPPNDTTYPLFYRASYMTNWYPICYTTEALMLAQSGYLASIVAQQWAGMLAFKTRNLSLSQQQMINPIGNFALVFETILIAFLLYCPLCNIAIGTRQIAFCHFLIPVFSFFICIFLYDEMRKLWLREGIQKKGGKVKYTGWVAQNTYY